MIKKNGATIMDREVLMQEVKDEYARLASIETQQHFHQTTTNITPEQYYENVLNMVLHEISDGTFDNFPSGYAIMEAVAKDKHKYLSEWDSRNLPH